MHVRAYYYVAILDQSVTISTISIKSISKKIQGISLKILELKD